MRQRYLLPVIFIPAASLSIVIFIILNLPAEPDKTELDLYFRAVQAYENADFDLCINLTEALAKGNPDFHQARLLKAKAGFFSGKLSQSAETLEELLKDKKNYYEAEIWLMRCYIQLGNINTAAEFGEDLISRAPEDPRVLGMLASLSMVESNYQKAIEYRSRVILFEEELALNRIELAKIYSALLNPEPAGLHLNKALILLADDSPLKKAVSDLINRMESEL